MQIKIKLILFFFKKKIGLAVGDIEAVRMNAKLKQRAMQVYFKILVIKISTKQACV